MSVRLPRPSRRATRSASRREARQAARRWRPGYGLALARRLARERLTARMLEDAALSVEAWLADLVAGRNHRAGRARQRCEPIRR